MYRIRPSVVQGPFSPIENGKLSHDWNEQHPNPNQLRWNPFDLPDKNTSVNFVQGLSTVAGAGDPRLRNGIAIHIFRFELMPRPSAWTKYLLSPQKFFAMLKKYICLRNGWKISF